mmetsp:Transcript_23442/g.41229  ORF Transcript_23442/g.41229 Transcript_23442/m.41229 type:complete len:324 (+) Transcript_23442:54-1025(+)
MASGSQILELLMQSRSPNELSLTTSPPSKTPYELCDALNLWDVLMLLCSCRLSAASSMFEEYSPLCQIVSSILVVRSAATADLSARQCLNVSKACFVVASPGDASFTHVRIWQWKLWQRSVYKRWFRRSCFFYDSEDSVPRAEPRMAREVLSFAWDLAANGGTGVCAHSASASEVFPLPSAVGALSYEVLLLDGFKDDVPDRIFVASLLVLDAGQLALLWSSAEVDSDGGPGDGHSCTVIFGSDLASIVEVALEKWNFEVWSSCGAWLVGLAGEVSAWTSGSCLRPGSELHGFPDLFFLCPTRAGTGAPLKSKFRRRFEAFFK